MSQKVFFTGSQLQNQIGKVLGEVEINGAVEIMNRNRPNMVLMLETQHREMELDIHSFKLDVRDLAKERDDLLAQVDELKTSISNSDYITHHLDFVNACEIAMEHAEPASCDSDDKGYWQKQLDTLSKLAKKFK